MYGNVNKEKHFWSVKLRITHKFLTQEASLITILNPVNFYAKYRKQLIKCKIKILIHHYGSTLYLFK